MPFFNPAPCPHVRYNENVPGHTAGEFGHNDFYPVDMIAVTLLMCVLILAP